MILGCPILRSDDGGLCIKRPEGQPCHMGKTEETYLEILVDLLPGPVMTVPLCDGVGHANEDVDQIVALPEPELLGNAVVNDLCSKFLGFAQVLAGLVRGGLHGLDLGGDGSNLVLSALNDLFGLHVITRAIVDTAVELEATVGDDIVLGNGSQDLVEESLVSLAASDRRRVSLHSGLLAAVVGAGGLHPSGRCASLVSRLCLGGFGARSRRKKRGECWV